MARWLKDNTKHFGRMSMELVNELAQLMFVIPHSQGGGTFSKGETIVCKGVKPRLIYVVYSGSVRACSLIQNYPSKAESNRQL